MISENNNVLKEFKMLAYRRMWIGGLTLAAMGLSFFISRQLTDIFEHIYWFNMSAFWAAELLIGVTLATMMKPDERTMPVQFIPIWVSGIYFVYVVIIAISCTGSVTENGLLSLHMIGLFAAVAVMVFSGMAQNAAGKLDQEQKRKFFSKNEFKIEIEKLKMNKRDLLSCDAEVSKKFANLVDAVNFASDSVAGCEEIDATALTALLALSSCENSGDMCSALDNAISQLQLRQNIIKIRR